MGMTSVLIISNDLLHRIKDDPQFGARVFRDAAGFRVPENFRALAPYGEVISVGHMDSEQIVSVYGGRGAPLPADEVEALLKYRRNRDRKKRVAREKEGA